MQPFSTRGPWTATIWKTISERRPPLCCHSHLYRRHVLEAATAANMQPRTIQQQHAPERTRTRDNGRYHVNPINIPADHFTRKHGHQSGNYDNLR